MPDFENRERTFPAIDSRFKFSLLTIGHDVTSAGFVFFLTDPTQLNEPERCFTLSAEDIARINPNTKTLIDEAKGRAGNSWGVSFHTRIWHMAEDSAWFRTASQLQEAGFVRDGSNWIPVQGLRPQQGALGLSGGNDDRSLPLGEGASGRNRERYVPLYEAKMIHQFDHRWATYQAGDSRDVTRTEKQNGNFEPAPRYWVPEGKPQERLGLGIAARFVV